MHEPPQQLCTNPPNTYTPNTLILLASRFLKPYGETPVGGKRRTAYPCAGAPGTPRREEKREHAPSAKGSRFSWPVPCSRSSRPSASTILAPAGQPPLPRRAPPRGGTCHLKRGGSLVSAPGRLPAPRGAPLAAPPSDARRHGQAPGRATGARRGSGGAPRGVGLRGGNRSHVHEALGERLPACVPVRGVRACPCVALSRARAHRVVFSVRTGQRTHATHGVTHAATHARARGRGGRARTCERGV